MAALILRYTRRCINTLATAPSRKPRVVLECGFGDFISHSDREHRSLCKQIMLSLATNRISGELLSLSITGLQGDLKERAEKLMEPMRIWQQVERFECSLPEMTGLNRDQVIVLSPDADEPFGNEPLDLGKVYCIGAIVDRTVTRGITFDWAQQQHFEMRRLPLKEHAIALGLSKNEQSLRNTFRRTGRVSSHALNINAVVASLIEFHKTQDWLQALNSVVPSRKRNCYDD